MKRALIVVPHEDDELSVAGQLIVSLNRAKTYEVYVLFVTNGDTFLPDGFVRLKEALSALQILGVPKENVIFLGYANSWKGRYHIYNSKPDETVESISGKIYTYGLVDHPEYIWNRELTRTGMGIHHTYTKEHLEEDLLNAMIDVCPSLLVSVDYDTHADHRMTALMFDRCVGKYLKRNLANDIVVWKKFAYRNVWDGRRDYYSYSITKNCGGNETENPTFLWEDRVCLAVEENCITKLLQDNILYKAALCHRSQNAWPHMYRVCNSDVVYFKRNTKNKMLYAHISATSGRSDCLNDFVILDNADIRDRNHIILNEDMLWHPVDICKEANIYWDIPVKATKIIFYENPNQNEDILNIHVYINGCLAFETGELKHSGYGSEYVLPEEYRLISSMTIRIVGWTGRMYGLTEIELVDGTDICELPEGLKLYEQNRCIVHQWDTEIIREAVTFALREVLETFIFPNIFIMRKKYSILLEHPKLLNVYWIINWFVAPTQLLYRIIAKRIKRLYMRFKLQ